MPVPRLYLPHGLERGATLLLDGDAAHHVRQVLRLGPGATLRVFDGSGAEHHARLCEVQRQRVTVEIGVPCDARPESPLAVTLAQGVPRGERMDFILQKAVELGVTAVQPLWMERSQGRVKGDRLERRMRHWRKVMVSACEQCGRGVLPVLADPLALPAWLDTGRMARTRLVLVPGAPRTLRDIAPPAGELLLLVGPEGGIGDGELAQTGQAGFALLSLGPRILRTETAALAALASVQALWGDFR
jgi:16S rRNA (uracil1498-N3)-methyltransferase